MCELIVQQFSPSISMKLRNDIVAPRTVSARGRLVAFLFFFCLFIDPLNFARFRARPPAQLSATCSDLSTRLVFITLCRL
jgi:hypothetical protein